jgi:hypothetical protein
MLVRELILELEAILKDHPQMGMAEVTTEGCDCDGDVGRIEVRDDDVYLRRS